MTLASRYRDLGLDMPLVYVVEGPDAVGKTTYADRLAADLAEVTGQEVRRVHNDAEDAKLPGSLYAHYRAQLYDAADFAKQGIATVIDRTFLSEAIYGPVYRGRSRITKLQAQRLQTQAQKLGIELVGLWAPLDERRRIIRNRGEAWTEKDAFVGAGYSVWFRHHRRVWRMVARSAAQPN